MGLKCPRCGKGKIWRAFEMPGLDFWYCINCRYIEETDFVKEAKKVNDEK